MGDDISLDVLKDFSLQDDLIRFQIRVNEERKSIEQLFLRTKSTIAALRRRQRNIDPKSDDARYVANLESKISQCYEVSSNFLTKLLLTYTNHVEDSQIPLLDDEKESSASPEEMESSFPTDGKEEERDRTLRQLEQAMEVVTRLARNNLHLYGLIAQHCPVKRVVRRLIRRFGGVDAFIRDLDTLVTSEVLDGGKYFLGMSMPVGLSALLTFGLGLSLTGWGLLLLLGGAAVGSAICAYKYKTDRAEMAEIKSEIQQLREQHAAFFERWKNPGIEMKNEDIQAFVRRQRESEEMAMLVVQEIFPEVEEPLWRYQHSCLICTLSFDQLDAKTPIVRPDTCNYHHFYCLPCIQEWESRNRDISLHHCVGCVTRQYSRKVVVSFTLSVEKPSQR